MSNNQKKDEKVEHFEIGEAKGPAAWSLLTFIICIVLVLVLAYFNRKGDNDLAKAGLNIMIIATLVAGIFTGVIVVHDKYIKK